MSTMTTIIKYQLDLTGKSPNNLVHDEIHKLKPAMNRVLVPKYGCFFTSINMKLRDVETGYILAPEVDYKPIMYHADATDRMGQEVCGGIVITNPAVSDHVAFTYQVCGGVYIKITELLVELIQNLNLDNRTILWGDLLGKPQFYKAGPHLHDIGDTYGWEYVVEALHIVRDAIYKGDEASHDHIYQVIDILRELVISNKDELDETIRLIQLRQTAFEEHTEQRFSDVLELINQNKDIFDEFVVATNNNFEYVINLINKNKDIFDDHVAHTLAEFVSVRARMDGIDQRHNSFVKDTNNNFVLDRKRMDNMDVRYDEFEKSTLDGFREDRSRMDGIDQRHNGFVNNVYNKFVKDTNNNFVLDRKRMDNMDVGYDKFEKDTNNNFVLDRKRMDNMDVRYDNFEKDTLDGFKQDRARLDSIDQRHNGFVNNVYNKFVKDTNNNFVLDRKRMDNMDVRYDKFEKDTNNNFVLDRKRMDNMDVRYDKFEKDTLDGFREDRARMDSMSGSNSSEFASVRARMDGIDQTHSGFVSDVYNKFVKDTNNNFVLDRKRMDNMDVRYDDFEQDTLDGFREDRARMDSMSGSASSVTDKVDALMGPGAIVRDEEGNLVFGPLSEMLAVKTKATKIDSDLTAFKEKLNKVDNYSREEYDQIYVLATGDEVKGQLKISKALSANHNLIDSQLLLQGGPASDVSIGFARENTTSCQLRHSGDGLILSGPTHSSKAEFRATGSIITEVGFGKESDIRLKSDICDIKGALDKVLSVRGATYIKQNKDEREAGVIAQEILKILPEAVFADKDGYLIVSYESIIPLLIEAIRDLNNKIVKLEDV